MPRLGGGLIRRRLPFYSRFHTNGTTGVDVFNQNVKHMPGSPRKCFGYCFLQPPLVGVVLAHIRKREARALIVVLNTRASWFPMIEGAGVRSVQIASQGEDSQFFRVHPQRGAEPHTFDRGGMRAVEVEFRGNNHAPRRDTQHPHTDKRTHIRTSRPVTAESVHAALIDYGHNAQSVHDNNAYARPAGPQQSPATPPPPPQRATYGRPYETIRLIRSILPILGTVVSLLVCGIPLTNTPPITLIRVSNTRGRVLCSKCHGENDDAFHVCQWCAAPSTYGSRDSDTALLCLDEYAIEQRFAQFTKAVAGKPSIRRWDSASLLFERFLQSRVAGGPAHIVTTQPNDVVAFLCWLDSCSEKRRTAVHARDCEAVGTSELSNCSTTEEGCTLRYAHDSLRTNYDSKLAIAYERDLGVIHDWNGTLRTGNPVRSDLVTQYMAFVREAQKKAGVEVSQAPTLLHSDLAAIIAHMTLCIRCTQDPHDRKVLARDIALFTVAFSTLKRGDELSRTLIPRILRLPNECSFLFNFQ